MLAYEPDGRVDEGRTRNNLLGRQVLWPIELLPHTGDFSQPLYKYYTTIFKKNQIFTFQLCHIKVNLTA